MLRKLDGKTGRGIFENVAVKMEHPHMNVMNGLIFSREGEGV